MENPDCGAYASVYAFYWAKSGTTRSSLAVSLRPCMTDVKPATRIQGEKGKAVESVWALRPTHQMLRESIVHDVCDAVLSSVSM